MSLTLGFTGTREGMTYRQKDTLIQLLRDHLHPAGTVHHGCCVGADAEFHDLVRKHYPEVLIVAHPTTSLLLQDTQVRENCDDFWPSARPLTRNKDIVNCSELLIAAPLQGVEQLRSGTWSTIRYAFKRIGVLIISPSGAVRREP